MKKAVSSKGVRAHPSWKIGIVASSYYQEEIDGLVAGATEVLLKAGIKKSNIVRIDAPGSFEIPLLGEAALQSGAVDALMGFGIIVQGETKHADLLAAEVARGIMDVQLTYCAPFAFEVLYVENLGQATERCIGKGNKGEEAAVAVLKSLAELEKIQTRVIE